MIKNIFDNLACNNCDSRSTFSLNIFLYLIILSFVFYYTGIQKKIMRILGQSTVCDRPHEFAGPYEEKKTSCPLNLVFLYI